MHFEGAFAEIVNNKNLLTATDKFCQPMFNKKNIPYCGLDIALDKQNHIWLIEGNYSPGFGYLLKNKKGSQLKLAQSIPKPKRILIFFIENGDPGTIRTCDLLLRRQLLYPAELRDHNGRNYTTGNIPLSRYFY